MKIGIIGAPGSGKDMLADFFIKYKGFKRFAFADKIKEEFYKISNYTEQQFKLSRGSELELQIRKELWQHSIEKTNNNKSYFIDPIIVETNMYDNVVISDVRTQTELDAIKKTKFIPILILRNFIKELEGELFQEDKVIPGTQIPINKIIDCPIFWNIYNIEDNYNNLYKFYNLLKEKCDMNKKDYYST